MIYQDKICRSLYHVEALLLCTCLSYAEIMTIALKMEPRTSLSGARGGPPLLLKVKTQSIILLLFLVFLGCSTFSLKVNMCTNFAIASTTTYLNKI